MEKDPVQLFVINFTLLDLNLPETNGFEFLEQMNRIDRPPNIKTSFNKLISNLFD